MTKMLMVLTSHGKLGDTGEPTGFWWEEVAAPYSIFQKYGYGIDLASPKGGKPPADPRSDVDEISDDIAKSTVRQFQNDEEAMKKLSQTMPLADVNPEDYDGVFFVGGHGTMWDFPNNPNIKGIIKNIDKRNGIIAAVCHGPAAFIGVTDVDGNPFVMGCNVTGFSDMEEELVGLEKVVPYLLEDQLSKLGAEYESTDPWMSLSLVSNRVVTGQNPASSTAAAMNLVNAIRNWKGGEKKAQSA